MHIYGFSSELRYFALYPDSQLQKEFKEIKNYNGKGWPITHLKDENPLSIIWKFQISSRNEDW